MRPVVLGMLAVTLAVAGSACSSKKSTADSAGVVSVTAKGGGSLHVAGLVDVEVPPGSVGSDTKLRATRSVVGNPDGFDAAGDGVTLSLDQGPLTGPVTLRFPLPDGADHGVAGVAFREAGGKWTPVDTAIDPSQKTMTVTTTHFSDWRTWLWHSVGWLDKGVGAVLQIGSLRADPPACAKPPDGVITVAPDNLRDILLGCVEPAGAGVRFKIVNNRGYSTTLLAPQDATLDNVTFGGAQAAISQALADQLGDHLPVFLPGGETATFTTTSMPSGDETFRSAPNLASLAADLAEPLLDKLLARFSDQTLAAKEILDCAIQNAKTANKPTVIAIAQFAAKCTTTVAKRSGIVTGDSVFDQFSTALAQFQTGVRLGDLTIDNYTADGLGELNYNFPVTNGRATSLASECSHGAMSSCDQLWNLKPPAGSDPYATAQSCGGLVYPGSSGLSGYEGHCDATWGGPPPCPSPGGILQAEIRHNPRFDVVSESPEVRPIRCSGLWAFSVIYLPGAQGGFGVYLRDNSGQLDVVLQGSAAHCLEDGESPSDDAVSVPPPDHDVICNG